MTQVTGKKLQVRVDEKMNKIIFCRFCQNRNKYLSFKTLPIDTYGNVQAAIIQAKTYIKVIEELTDGELKVDSIA